MKIYKHIQWSLSRRGIGKKITLIPNLQGTFKDREHTIRNRLDSIPYVFQFYPYLSANSDRLCAL